MARLAGGLVLVVLGIAVLGLRGTEVTRRRPFWIVQHAGNLRMFLAAATPKRCASAKRA